MKTNKFRKLFAFSIVTLLGTFNLNAALAQDNYQYKAWGLNAMAKKLVNDADCKFSFTDVNLYEFKEDVNSNNGEIRGPYADIRINEDDFCSTEGIVSSRWAEVRFIPDQALLNKNLSNAEISSTAEIEMHELTLYYDSELDIYYPTDNVLYVDTVTVNLMWKGQGASEKTRDQSINFSGNRMDRVTYRGQSRNAIVKGQIVGEHLNIVFDSETSTEYNSTEGTLGSGVSTRTTVSHGK